jgi:hypothetical protein
MLPDCQQHGERMEALEARRRRFERDAERPVPPLPLFGAGPARAQGARRTQAGGNVTKVPTEFRVQSLFELTTANRLS